FFFFCKAEPDDPVILVILVKHRDGYRRDAIFFGDPEDELLIGFVADPVVFVQLEEAAVRGQGREPGWFHQPCEMVALALHKSAQSQVGLLIAQVFRQRHLRRGMTAEAVELVDFPELAHERRRRHAVSQLPTRAMIHLPEGKRYETSFQQPGITKDRSMGQTIEDKMLIYFIGMDQDIRAFDDLLQLLDIALPQYRARWVVRAIQQDHPCTGRYPPSHLVPIDTIVGETQIDPHGNGAIDLDVGYITIVGRFKYDDFIAGGQYGRQRGIDGIGAAGSDGDLRVGIDGSSIQTGDLFGQYLSQRRQPVHVCILVIPVPHGPVDERYQLFAHRVIGEALPQV